MIKKIVFTGGGTAGHVTPNLALMRLLAEEGTDIVYIGSANSVEAHLVKAENYAFFSVQSGKLRRYFSWQNFIDPFKLVWGIIQAYFMLAKIKPDLVFSKGGFVAVPVVLGAWLRKIPVVAHESDLHAGLANRLSFPFVKRICVTFAEGALQFSDKNKVVVTGTPIRMSLLSGNKDVGQRISAFNELKPCLMVIGGSQGAQRINEAVRQILDKLLVSFNVIHICGQDKLDAKLKNIQGYAQFEYVNQELADLFAAADLVVSRAGANALYELMVLQKPNILIPLSKRVSRGDQIDNAAYFKKLNVSQVLNDDSFNANELYEAILLVYAHRDDIKARIAALGIDSANERIIHVIKESSGSLF